MKIAVCVKQAVDETELKLDAAGSPVLAGASGKMSAFDKNAVEEALRLKTKHQGEVAVFMLGGAESKKTLKEALAMGADRGVLITADTHSVDALRTSEVLAAALRRSGPYDLVVCSEGSSDTYTGQVPPMLGELLGLPYVGYARKIEIAGQSATIERSLEDSVERVESPLPLAISVVSEINEPRYPTLIQIMQAGKKPVEELKAEDVAPAEGAGRVVVSSMSSQPSVRKRVMIEGSPEEAAVRLLEALTKEGVL